MKKLEFEQMETIEGGFSFLKGFGCFLAGAAAATLAAPLGPLAAVGGALTYGSCLALQ